MPGWKNGLEPWYQAVCRPRARGGERGLEHGYHREWVVSREGREMRVQVSPSRCPVAFLFPLPLYHQSLSQLLFRGPSGITFSVPHTVCPVLCSLRSSLIPPKPSWTSCPPRPAGSTSALRWVSICVLQPLGLMKAGCTALCIT